jgi:hypothetical protein
MIHTTLLPRWVFDYHFGAACAFSFRFILDFRKV